MGKQRTLIIAVVILTIMNIATLSFLWFSKSDKRHHRNMRQQPNVENYLTRKLKLSKEQADEFKTARRKHFENTQSLLRSLHADRHSLSEMLSNVDTIKQNELILKISNKNAQLERLNFLHFQNLRAICTEEQKQKFDSVISKVIDKGTRFRKKLKSHKQRK